MDAIGGRTVWPWSRREPYYNFLWTNLLTCENWLCEFLIRINLLLDITIHWLKWHDQHFRLTWNLLWSFINSRTPRRVEGKTYKLRKEGRKEDKWTVGWDESMVEVRQAKTFCFWWVEEKWFLKQVLLLGNFIDFSVIRHYWSLLIYRGRSSQYKIIHLSSSWCGRITWESVARYRP